MFPLDHYSPLIATGLPFTTLAKLISSSDSDSSLLSQLETLGKKYAFRYTTVKKYFDLIHQGKQKLPLILLLAGIPGVGKSSLAKSLSTAFNINIILGGDALRSAIRSIIPRKGNEVFFTSLYDTWRSFGTKSKDTIYSGFEAQSQLMNTAVQRIIADRGLRDGESLILEYIHFLPHQFDSALLQHPSIIPIVLDIHDKDEYINRLKNRSNFTHLRSPGDRLINQLDQYLTIQDILCSEARKHKLTILDVDDFSVAFDALLSYVIQRIDKLNSLKDYNEPIPFLKQLEAERKKI